MEWNMEYGIWNIIWNGEWNGEWNEVEWTVVPAARLLLLLLRIFPSLAATTLLAGNPFAFFFFRFLFFQRVASSNHARAYACALAVEVHEWWTNGRK